MLKSTRYDCSKSCLPEKIRPLNKVTYRAYVGLNNIFNLARYYKVRRMKIIVDGRRVGNGYEASYDCETYTAYFKKKGLDKFNVLHEFYHRIINVRG
mgnify:CR=1 FL=1